MVKRLLVLIAVATLGTAARGDDAAVNSRDLNPRAGSAKRRTCPFRCARYYPRVDFRVHPYMLCGSGARRWKEVPTHAPGRSSVWLER